MRIFGYDEKSWFFLENCFHWFAGHKQNIFLRNFFQSHAVQKSFKKISYFTIWDYYFKVFVAKYRRFFTIFCSRTSCLKIIDIVRIYFKDLFTKIISLVIQESSVQIIVFFFFNKNLVLLTDEFRKNIYFFC